MPPACANLRAKEVVLGAGRYDTTLTKHVLEVSDVADTMLRCVSMFNLLGTCRVTRDPLKDKERQGVAGRTQLL